MIKRLQLLMAVIEGKEFDFPPREPKLKMSGAQILSEGVDNAIHILLCAETGKPELFAHYVNQEYLRSLGGLQAQSLHNLHRNVSNLMSEGPIPPVSEKDALRLTLSLVHALIKEDVPGLDGGYYHSGKFYRDAIEFCLEKLEIGKLMPPEEILHHKRRLNHIAERVGEVVKDQEAKMVQR